MARHTWWRRASVGALVACAVGSGSAQASEPDLAAVAAELRPVVRAQTDAVLGVARGVPRPRGPLDALDPCRLQGLSPSEWHTVDAASHDERATVAILELARAAADCGRPESSWRRLYAAAITSAAVGPVGPRLRLEAAVAEGNGTDARAREQAALLVLADLKTAARDTPRPAGAEKWLGALVPTTHECGKFLLATWLVRERALPATARLEAIEGLGLRLSAAAIGGEWDQDKLDKLAYQGALGRCDHESRYEAVAGILPLLVLASNGDRASALRAAAALVSAQADRKPVDETTVVLTVRIVSAALASAPEGWWTTLEYGGVWVVIDALRILQANETLRNSGAGAEGTLVEPARAIVAAHAEEAPFPPCEGAFLAPSLQRGVATAAVGAHLLQVAADEAAAEWWGTGPGDPRLADPAARVALAALWCGQGGSPPTAATCRTGVSTGLDPACARRSPTSAPDYEAALTAAFLRLSIGRDILNTSPMPAHASHQTIAGSADISRWMKTSLPAELRARLTSSRWVEPLVVLDPPEPTTEGTAVRGVFKLTRLYNVVMVTAPEATYFDNYYEESRVAVKAYPLGDGRFQVDVDVIESVYTTSVPPEWIPASASGWLHTNDGDRASDQRDAQFAAVLLNAAVASLRAFGGVTVTPGTP